MVRHAIAVTLFFAVLFASALHAAQPAYVTDTFKITFRSGPGTQHKIISMLNSGQPVEILESQDEWSQVRVATSGAEPQEGWVLSQYLIQRQPWQTQAEVLTAGNSRLKDQVKTLREQVAALEQNSRDLSQKLGETTRNLETVTSDYRTLEQGSAEYLQVKNKLDAAVGRLQKVEADYAALDDTYKKLKYSERNTWFAIGAGILLFGVLFGMILGRREKRHRPKYS